MPAYTSVPVDVTGGTITFGGTALANNQIEKAEINFNAELAEMPSWGNFPAKEYFLKATSVDGSITYWLKKGELPKVADGTSIATIITLPAALVLTGSILITKSTPSIQVGEFVKVALNFVVKPGYTLALS